jgi:hypothetical protein
VRVDFVDVFAQFGAWLGLDVLDLLEATALHEGALCFQVLGQDLGELSANVGEDVVGGEREKWFEGWDMGAHLDDVLEGLFRLVLQVLGAVLQHEDGQEAGWHVSLGQELCVLWRVAANLTERPGSSGLQVVLWLVDQSILEWGNTLRDDDSHGERVVEGGNVAESHDTWKTSVALRLTDVVDSGSSATRVDDELGEFSSLLGNLTDASGSIFANLNVDVLQAVQDAWENLSLDNNLGEVDGMLGDLSEALADVTLELGVWVGDQGGQVGDGTLVDNGLSKLLSVLGNLGESGGRDTFQSKLWLLNAEDEKSNSASIDNGLSELVVMLGNARKSESSCLLDGWVELLKAVDKSVKSARVNDSLGQVRRVLGNRSEHVCSGFFVEALELKEFKSELTNRNG